MLPWYRVLFQFWQLLHRATKIEHANVEPVRVMTSFQLPPRCNFMGIVSAA
jgi:hypothetical protein